MNHGRQDNWCVVGRAGSYMYAMYFWHSEGLSTRHEELLKTMWKSMSGARYGWTQWM